MYNYLGPGQTIELDEPSSGGVELLYGHEFVANRWRSRPPATCIGAIFSIARTRDLSLYSYCGDNPIGMTDPTGLIKWGTAKSDAQGQWRVQTDAGNWIDITLSPDAYNCHSYTFGGVKVPAGTFWINPDAVPTILKDDGWKRIPCCAAVGGDIVVWYNWRSGKADHSGKIDRSFLLNFQCGIDPEHTIVTSKHGLNTRRTETLQAVQDAYGGFYSCYSKGPKEGGIVCCLGHNERGKDQKAGELRRPDEEYFPGDF